MVRTDPAPVLASIVKSAPSLEAVPVSSGSASSLRPTVVWNHEAFSTCLLGAEKPPSRIWKAACYVRICGSGSNLGDSCDDCIEIAIRLVRVVSNIETRRANSIGQVIMIEGNEVDYVPTITSSALSVFEEEHDLRGAW